METLLPAVRQALLIALPDFRPGDIYIARHENVIPATARPPCIGIKDGDIAFTELAAGLREKTMQVHLAIYLPYSQSDGVVLGDGRNQGILAVATGVRTALWQNFLALPGVIFAACIKETASEMFGDDHLLLQRKIVTYQYIKEEEIS